MKYKDEALDNLDGLDGMLPTEVLKILNFFDEPDEQSGACSDSAMTRKGRLKINQLLGQQHRAGHPNNGSKIEIVYVASGGQHVDTQVNIGAYPNPGLTPTPSPKDEGNLKGMEKGAEDLPQSLATDEAMTLWKKAQSAGYVDGNYQPLISRTQAALLADAMAERLGIKEKWKVFETLWNRKNMYRDYYKALNLQQSLTFQDKIKRLFR